MAKKILILKAVIVVDSTYLEHLKKQYGESFHAKLLEEFKCGTMEIIDHQFRDANLIVGG